MTKLKILEENWKRALADYQNLVKRVDSDKKEFIKLATAGMISKFLPSVDALEIVVKQLRDVLKDEGLQEINPREGDVFDPGLHECTETVLGGNQDTIAELVFKGYKINDYVIRAAKVKVFTKTS